MDELIDRTDSINAATALHFGNTIIIEDEALKDSIVYLYDNNEELGAGSKGLVIAGNSPWVMWIWK